MQKTMFVIKRKPLLLNQAIKTYPFFEKKSKFSTFFNIYLKYPFLIKSANISVENRNLFWNCCFDKGRLKNFVSWFLNTYGEKKTIELLEQLKNLGFGYATKAGISLGIDDLKIPPQKFHFLSQAESQIFKGNEKYKKGQITEVERIQRLIDVWNQTSEFLKQEVIQYFEKTDLFNPVYMMAFSGARGNISQVRQLVGMRGLMSDPQGNIIDFPIQSNFREGLTLTEYIISTYGARKGIVDTALRTATAGYLTRRLVDVAQHVMISQFDCGTTRGIFLFDMKEGIKTIYSFQNRLIGRVLGRDIIHPNNRSLFLGYRNQEISSSLADSIVKVTKKAFVRSPLTCETRQFVCQLCYGWSLASSKLVSVGEAVGVIAAQSIGEPGTQLTMRTFHTGGVFSGGLTNQIVSPYDGFIEYSETIPGTCIRTPRGDIGFLTKSKGSFFIKEIEFKKENKKIQVEINDTNNHLDLKSTISTSLSLNVDSSKLKPIFQSKFYTIPSYAILFVRNKEPVFKKQIIAQFSEAIQPLTPKGYAEQTVYTQLEGQVSFFQIDLLERQNEKLLNDIVWRTMDWSKIWVLSGKIYYDALGLNTFVLKGDFLSKNSIFQKIYWHNLNSCFLDISLNKRKNFHDLKSKIENQIKSKKNEIKPLINVAVSHLDLSFLNLKKKDYLNFLNKKQKGKEKDEKKKYYYSITTKNFCLNSLNFNQNLKFKFSTKKIFLKENLGFNIFSKSFIPKFKKNHCKQKKYFNQISLRILLKNKRLSPYIYPYRTKVSSFLFKKMNRINFFSYYIKFMISKRKKKKALFRYMNKDIQTLNRNHKIIKKRINPFVFKSSIPNYFQKKIIKNKILTFLKFESNDFDDLIFQIKDWKESKISNHQSADLHEKSEIFPRLIEIEDFNQLGLNRRFKPTNQIKQRSVDSFKSVDILNLKSRISLKNRRFFNDPLFKVEDFQDLNQRFKSSISNRRFEINSFKSLDLKLDFSESTIPWNLQDFNQRFKSNQIKKESNKEFSILNKSKKLEAKGGINFAYFKLSKNNIKSIFISSYFKEFKNQNKVQINQSYSMRKSLLSLPVNQIVFQKLGYIFSIKRKPSSYFRIDKVPSDFILSFFPLKNLENMPFHSFNKNDPGKNFQKLSLGNTQNFSPFSKMAFRWFPFEYKTGSNGIFIWSKNFLSYNSSLKSKDFKETNKELSKIQELGSKTKNLMNQPNPDFYIKNYYFIQKKRWILGDGILKKNNKKEINLFFDLKSKISNQRFQIKKSEISNSMILNQRFKIIKSPICMKNQRFFKHSISQDLNQRFKSSISNRRFEINQRLEIKSNKGKSLINNESFFKKSNSMKFRYIFPLNQKFQTFVTKQHLKKIFFFNKYLNNQNMSLFHLISKFTKFSVYKQDFYFIPQENSRFNIWSNLKENTNLDFYNFFSNVYLSNRQGLKKLFSPNLSGFARIYNSSQNNLKSSILNQMFEFEIEDFQDLNQRFKSSISNRRFEIKHLNHRFKTKGFQDLNQRFKSSISNRRFEIKKSEISNSNTGIRDSRKHLISNQRLEIKSNKSTNDYYKIKKKASYKLDLSIRNKMIQNIFYKLFIKKNNKVNIPIKSEKQIKNSFYKSKISNKKIKEKTLIAQLKNQSLFFSCFPFRKFDILNGKSSILFDLKSKILNQVFEFETKDFQDLNQRFKSWKSLVSNKSQTFDFKSKILTSHKKENKRNKKFLLVHPTRTQVEKIIKPGWVYCLINVDFLSVNSNFKSSKESNPRKTYKTNSILSLKNRNLLYIKKIHQNFMNPGKKIIHDICFEQNKIFIENINFLNQPLKNKHFLSKQIKVAYIYTNQNCRFFDGPISTEIFKEKNLLRFDSLISDQRSEILDLNQRFKSWKSNSNKESNHQRVLESEMKSNGNFLTQYYKTNQKYNFIENIGLLFRPVYYKILPNPQLFKTHISRNQKDFDSHFSILFYKNFHSKFLNQQTSDKKILSKSPSLDFYIREVSPFHLASDNKRFQKDFAKKLQTIKTNQKKSLDFPMVLKEQSQNQRKKKFYKKIKYYSKILKKKHRFNIIGNHYFNCFKNLREKQLNLYIEPNKLRSYFFENLFYSAYKCHFFSLELKTTKSLGFDFGFNIPMFYLKRSDLCSFGFGSNHLDCSLNLKSHLIFQIKDLKESKISNKRNNGLFFNQKKSHFSQVFLKLIKKNQIRKQFFLTSNQIRKNTFFNQMILSKGSKISLISNQRFQSNLKSSILKNILYKDSDVFFSFFYLCPFQRMEWAFVKKEAYLANYISSMNKLGEESSSKRFANPYNLNSNLISNRFEIFDFKYLKKSKIFQGRFEILDLNQRFKSWKPKVKGQGIFKHVNPLSNQGIQIKNKKFYNMPSFSFSFPFFENSFLLYKAYNKIIANKVYASTNIFSPFEGEILTQNANKWWQNFKEIELKHKKFDIKYNIFLTKKDIFSISIKLNPFEPFISNLSNKESTNETKYPSIFSFLSLRNKGFIINPKQEIHMELLNNLQLPIDIWKGKEHNEKFHISNFVTKYQNKVYKLKGLSIGKYLGKKDEFHLGLGKFLLKGDHMFFKQKIDQTGQIIHLSSKKITLRYAQPFLLSPRTILHVQQGDFIYRNAPILTLPFDTLTTGDIVQGIPKVEQYLEARTTQNGRFFLYSLPVLQKAIFERYRSKLPLEQAVAQSFLKIQQIIVDGVQRVYRSQGVSIAEKHLEVIVKQMTSKVQIIHGGQTGFFPGELVDLDIVENVNKFLMVKIRYEPIVLGITRASLEVESFLSAASFQQTTKILAKASLSKKKDYLKGLKENLLVGNLIPAGTGFINSYI